MQRLANGELEFKRPNGWVIPEAPALPPVPGDPVRDLRAANEAAGLRLDGRALSGTWSGERFSVTYAIDVMHPRAIATRPWGYA